MTYPVAPSPILFCTFFCSAKQYSSQQDFVILFF